MAGQLPPAIQKIVDKFSNSRDFTISFVLHAIIVAIFGGTVLFQAVQEPPDFEGGDSGFVEASDTPQQPQPQQQQPTQTTFNVTTVPTPTTQSMNAITTTSAVNPLDFSMTPTVVAPVVAQPTAPTPQIAAPAPAGADNMPTAVASQIKAFTGGWGKGSGSGTGTRSREFQFTAYIGQYAGGNWDSTVRIVSNKIETGSLPNLLYLMSIWSKDKIKTNYQNVKVLRLDSDELFSVKPPFIFLTGTRDFVLTPAEVANLQKYIRMGGCVWGDSSVPGLRSRFDIAFRREMKRVIPDVDKDFEPLPPNHPIYTQGYYPEIKDVVPGLNFYKLPIYAMKIYGEIAVIYTANDYGDMWQIGLNDKGEVDLRVNATGAPIAVNRTLLAQKDVYIRNLDTAALATSYKFGTNIVIHLLTRWEDKVKTAPTL